MGAVERRVGRWADLLGDLVAGPLTAYPRREISAHLHETFGCQVSWAWRDPPDRSGFDLHVPMGDWPSAEVRAALADALPHHPVLRRYVVTGDLAPTSVGRVPSALVTRRGRQVMREHLVPVGMEQQLVIAYRLGRGEHRAFVLARAHHDFSDEDLRVAAAVQPLLALVDRQVSALGGRPPASGPDLSGRELAVLRLLAQGLTATSIGSRLAISERTVHRHLQGVYRKLGAHDRLTAVLTARDAGLLVDPPRL